MKLYRTEQGTRNSANKNFLATLSNPTTPSPLTKVETKTQVPVVPDRVKRKPLLQETIMKKFILHIVSPMKKLKKLSRVVKGKYIKKLGPK